MPAAKPRQLITFDRKALERLKTDRQKAIEQGHTMFEFDGNVFLVTYAQYLIEYLDDKLAKH